MSIDTKEQRRSEILVSLDCHDSLVEGDGSTIRDDNDSITIRHTPHNNRVVARQSVALDNFAFRQLSRSALDEINFVLHLVREVSESITFRQTLLPIHPFAFLVVDTNQNFIHLILVVGSTVHMKSPGISLRIPYRRGLDLYLFHNNIYIQFE